jgi:regulator of RNase E activity RraA
MVDYVKLSNRAAAPIPPPSTLWIDLKKMRQGPSEGAVLVVGGGQSLESALLEDVIAGLARKNVWAGIILFGAARDSVALGRLPISWS